MTSDSYAVWLMEADMSLYVIPQMQANWKKHDGESLEKVSKHALLLGHLHIQGSNPPTLSSPQLSP